VATWPTSAQSEKRRVWDLGRFIAGPTRVHSTSIMSNREPILGILSEGDPFGSTGNSMRTASKSGPENILKVIVEWMSTRADKNSLTSPFAIYEMHPWSLEACP